MRTAEWKDSVLALTRSRLINRLLWLLLIVEAVIAYFATKPWITGDSGIYWDLAQGLSAGCFGHFDGAACAPTPLRPPGYPILLATFSHALRLPFAALVLMQLAAYLSALAIIDHLFVEQREGAAIFKLLALAYPAPLFYSSQISAESWSILLVSVGTFLLMRGQKKVSAAFGAGLAFGFAGLLRTDLLPLSALAVVLQLLQSGLQLTYSRSFLRAIVTGVGSLAMLLPFAAWNSMTFNHFTPVPVASAAGSSLYLASWQELLTQKDFLTLYSGHPNDAVLKSGIINEFAKVNESIGASKDTLPFNPAAYTGSNMQIAANKALAQKAKERIASAPALYVRHILRNAWSLWNTSEYPSRLPKIIVFGLQLGSAIVFVFGMTGIVLGAAGKLPLPHSRFCAAVLVCVVLVHIPFHTEARYTAAARPLLLLLAAASIANFLNWQPPSPRPCGASPPKAA